jgi:hypothetical protein
MMINVSLSCPVLSCDDFFRRRHADGYCTHLPSRSSACAKRVLFVSSVSRCEFLNIGPELVLAKPATVSIVCRVEVSSFWTQLRDCAEI